jgi:hypothetical protein
MTSPADQVATLLRDLSLLDDLPDNARQIIKQLIPLQKAGLRQECQFLAKLPPEIRNKIYRLLLVNPDLAERSCVEKDNQFRRQTSGEPVAYELSPALLTTCKQIYREASHVLYEENVFLISFADKHGYPVCPLARYPAYRHGFNKAYPHPSLKVRRWKVVIDLSNILCDATFKYLCRILAHLPPKSLEISLVPTSNIWPEPRMREWLKPLRKLRNVDKFTLSDAPTIKITASPWEPFAHIVSQFQVPHPMHLLSRVQGCHSLARELKHLVEGNSPVELLPEMYNCLVYYFASFERYELFRSMFEQEYRCDPDIHLGLIGQGGHSMKKHNLLQLGTYENDYPPMSSTLSDAYVAVTENEDVRFKDQRVSILNRLEPQYQRIAAAYRSMAAFVEHEKLRGGIFEKLDPVYIYPDVWWNKHYKCVALLEEYADALKIRDTMIEDQAEIEIQQAFLESHYRTLQAESAIRELRWILDGEKHFGFRDLFKRALDDLDSQYMIICKARSALYSCDKLNEPGCTIGLDEDFPLQ